MKGGMRLSLVGLLMSLMKFKGGERASSLTKAETLSRIASRHYGAHSQWQPFNLCSCV